jgi:hypothetical protein
MQCVYFHFLISFDSFRCDDEGKPASFAAQYKQKELYAFYCEITYCMASQMSESSFKEYYTLETRLKFETRKRMEVIYQTRRSLCITKQNLLNLARYPEKDIAPYLASTVSSAEFQIAMLENMLQYRDW